MRYLFFLLLAASVAACSQSPEAANARNATEAEATSETVDDTGKTDMTDADFEAMANELCDCLQPVLQLTRDLQQKQSEGDEAGMAALLDNLENIMKTSEACVDGVDQKYRVTTEEEQRKATMAMQQSCPDIMAMLNSLQ